MVTANEEGGEGAEKTFDQSDVDRIVQERLAREREKYSDYDELKEAAEAAKAEAEANKTEQQKLLDRLDAAEKTAQEAQKAVAKAEAEALRAKVAADKGLSAAQAARLVGETEEELAADADALIEAFTAKAEGDGEGEDTGDGEEAEDNTPAATRQQPAANLKSGNDPETPVDETDPMKLANSIPRIS